MIINLDCFMQELEYHILNCYEDFASFNSLEISGLITNLREVTVSLFYF